MGHYIQLRREGVKPSGMVFIPFLGAAVATRSLGGSALAEARVGLAGPILGSIACLIPAALWVATGEEFWQALAFTGFFLNLFNLIPVVPFDGGRAMAAMTPWMWFVGLGAMAALLLVAPNPFVLLFLVLGAFTTYQRWKTRKAGEPRPRVSSWSCSLRVWGRRIGSCWRRRGRRSRSPGSSRRTWPRWSSLTRRRCVRSRTRG